MENKINTEDKFNHRVNRVLKEFFKQKLLLNMFGVYDKFGRLLLEPVMNDEDEFDLDYILSLEYYNELSKTILFADFYIDEEIGELTLLRNDVLEITIAIIHRDNESKLEFIGEKTIGDLVEKYPSLLKYNAW
jgi:hypothetical protein